jgi:Immunoglobulin I-set domain
MFIIVSHAALMLQLSNSEDVDGPPVLLQPLVDLVVAAGSSALFVCKVCGRPRPTIEWSGPGRAVIVPNERTKLNYSDNNVVTLQVKSRYCRGYTVAEMRADVRSGITNEKYNNRCFKVRSVSKLLTILPIEFYK